eukprot:jgi/Botrbrau1/5026/Bobra.0396s0039.1
MLFKYSLCLAGSSTSTSFLELVFTTDVRRPVERPSLLLPTGFQITPLGPLTLASNCLLMYSNLLISGGRSNIGRRNSEVSFLCG